MEGNLVAHADALDCGRLLTPGSVALAYLDPPFAVGVTFGARTARGGARASGPVAYDDRWPSMSAYLDWLEARLRAIYLCLSASSTLWLHLDHRAVHEAAVICDGVFGRARRIGEIIWVPGNGSKSRNGPGITHQTLLAYAKTDTFVWNSGESTLREPYASTSLAMHFSRVDPSGRRYRERTVAGKTYRYFADEGRALGSVWTDCPSMSANTPLRAETTGYPTQKPEKLLDRIVRASSMPGELVLDTFCGSGTTLAVAAKLGRRFAGFDIGARAIETTKARLTAQGASFTCVSGTKTETETDTRPA